MVLNLAVCEIINMLSGQKSDFSIHPSPNEQQRGAIGTWFNT